VVSETLVDRIDDFLERPEFDPHGSPIPPKGGGCPPRRGIPLNELPIGRRARIAEVADADAEFLRYLSSLNVAIGTEVVVLERAPYNGPVTLQIGADFAAIGLEAGKRIRVCMEEHLAG
jgi:DtxR family Mn-dependent transcriptional regulator